MGLLDAYQESIDTSFRVRDSLPIEPEAPKPKRSAWTAPFRAVAAGASEVVGNVMDTAGAFGQVVAASGGIGPGLDPDQAKNRQASVDAMDKLKTDGIDWRTPEAQQAYQFGRDLRPDPLTAGAAENTVFSLTKGLTKAVGAAVTLGPAGGALAFGGSEGMTTSEDLAVQGVDQGTRTKVGAVAAVMNTVGVALPVAGKTLTQTAALVAVGGPGSFMAQQAATREILRNADYKQLAEQYDPLDPVGLAVATLLPAGFAAYAKRGGFDKVGTNRPITETPPPEIGTPEAKTGNPVMETNQPVAATSDVIDAAMVHNLTVARDAHQSVAPEQVPAMFGIDETPPSAPMPVTKEVRSAEFDTPGQAADPTPDAYAARVETLTKEQPDLIARLDDTGQPVRLTDELAAIKKEAQEGTDTDFGALDAPLLKVAAECALSGIAAI